MRSSRIRVNIIENSMSLKTVGAAIFQGLKESKWWVNSTQKR